MRRLAAVVIREWGAQRNAALLAPALAGLAWSVAWLPVIEPRDRGEATLFASATLAVLYLLFLSITLGAATTPRPFDLNRPLRPSTLWFGRLAANALLTAAGAALIGCLAIREWPRASAALLLAIPLLMVVAHYGALAMRGGTRGVAADGGLFLFVLGTAWLSGRPFAQVFAWNAGWVMTGLWLPALVAGLTDAGLARVRGGAHDAREGARVARRALWRTTFCAGLAFNAAYALYVVLIPPVGGYELASAASGRLAVTVYVDRIRLDYFRMVMRDRSTGRRYDFAQPARRVYGEPRISADGRQAFWNSLDGDSIIHLDLRSGWLEALPLYRGVLAVSPDGSRLVTEDADGIAVQNVRGRRRIRFYPSGPGGRAAAFVAADRVRIADVRNDLLRIHDLDLATGRERVLDTLAVARVKTMAMNPSGSRIVITAANRLLLLDGSGRVLRDDSLQGGWVTTLLLDDGRLVLWLENKDNNGSLRLIDADGGLRAAYRWSRMVHRLAAAGGSAVLADVAWETDRIDLAAGTFGRIAPRWQPPPDWVQQLLPGHGSF
jgi:hypothetical protein